MSSAIMDTEILREHDMIIRTPVIYEGIAWDVYVL
jgi:hypothetical protein